ncbi:serine/arginine repetitive matrix protein 1-like isoform X2 [Schistocerca gregaria]|uniref:serine/arginine repetitive matrix protein 1-like isoform X2 n=1 Tax=Schistocerca gregaria TaxID=7010 RepID=UPI00211EAF63|nr:serine/arginine repetitive matrix protein 1-like isoform X2 [Schistocerca gregaria]
MAGRSQLPMPTRSAGRLPVPVRAPTSCPGAQPRATGLRPPQTYGSARASAPPCAPCAPSPSATPRASGLRAPQIRSGLRPPRRICMSTPQPSTSTAAPVCGPRRQRSPSPPPPCARSPSPPPPCARARSPSPPPCRPPPCAPAPCPAFEMLEGEPEDLREMLMSGESDVEAAARAAMRAQWAASLAAHPDTLEDQLRRVGERRRAATEQRWLEQVERVEAAADHRKRMMAIQREMQIREFQEKREEYNMTLEAVEEMLMEERDMMLRAQMDNLLARARAEITNEAQWHAAVGIADAWRRSRLEAYQPYAAAEARLAAEREMLKQRRRRYKTRMRPGPQMSPLEEAQVDVFDESPPGELPPPALPVFDRPPPSFDSRPVSLLDDSPPLDLQESPLLNKYRTPEQRIVNSAGRRSMVDDTMPPGLDD